MDDMTERTFTASEVQELMRRLGDSILEVLDADQDQCGAWARKGEALIDAMTSEPKCPVCRVIGSPEPVNPFTLGTHDPVIRPATSRFVDNDSKNGLEAECWDCGERIVKPSSANLWTHA